MPSQPLIKTVKVRKKEKEKEKYLFSHGEVVARSG
jgi:hypothetical protein